MWLKGSSESLDCVCTHALEFDIRLGDMRNDNRYYKCDVCCGWYQYSNLERSIFFSILELSRENMWYKQAISLWRFVKFVEISDDIMFE